MTTGINQTSFAGGELSPNLYARVDLEKYASGAALLSNFFVDYRGGVSNRAGTEYLADGYSNEETHLIPFVFATDQAYVIELSDLYLRVWYQGEIVDEMVTVYLAADLPTIKYVQSADVMTLTHDAYPPYNLSRTSLLVFSLDLVAIGPKIARPTGLAGTPTHSGNFIFGYMVTAINVDGEESLGCTPVVITSTLLDAGTGAETIVLSWTAAVDAVSYNIYKWGPIPNNKIPATLFGYISNTKITKFTDTNIAQDYTRTPPEFHDPFSPGQLTSITVTAAGTGYTAFYAPLVITPTGTGAVAAIGYMITDGSAVIGAVVQYAGKNQSTVVITESVTGTGATFTGTLDPDPHYPAVVSYVQQRRAYGGADANPENIQLSQIGLYDNFDRSPSQLDSDAIDINIASLQFNTIKSFVPMSTGLVVFTTGSAFLVSGATQGGPITPTSITSAPQASTGAGDLQPIVINQNIVFVQQQGSIVRDMAFNFQTQSYYGTDRSMLANHLFFGYQLVDWTYAEEPFRVVWAVRNDGKLLSLTYVPEQEVYGWAQHDTNGLVKSVCAVPEGDEDRLYLVVSRLVDGVWKNFIERMASRKFDCVQDCWFLDAAVSNPSEYPDATLTSTGLTGTVTLTADAAVFTTITVDDRVLVGCAQVEVTSVDTTSIVTGEVIYGELPSLSDGTPLPIASGDWSWTTPVEEIAVPHLVGKTVNVLADGQVIGETVVPEDGVVDFSAPGQPASAKVICGLPYTSKVKTLYLEIPSADSVQGKRKSIPSVNIRVDQTRGITSGPSDDALYEVKETSISIPQALYTGDYFQNVANDWNEYGQLVFEQTYPLPATILGVVPKVVVGDNSR